MVINGEGCHISLPGFYLRLFHQYLEMKSGSGLSLGSMVSSAAVPYYETLPVCFCANIVDNVVDRVFMFRFRTFLGAFCLVANGVVFGLFSCSSNSVSGLSLSITTVHGQICREEFSWQPF